MVSSNKQNPSPVNLDDRPSVKQLFKNLKKTLPKLEELLEKCSGEWGYEDHIYRFYHQSFKVYGLQTLTLKIVKTLKSLRPGVPLDDWFMQIIEEGTGKEHELEHNECWLQMTRPMLEAFFHARFFLEMAVKYGRELDYPPGSLPSGWAAFLYLYNLRF